VASVLYSFLREKYVIEYEAHRQERRLVRADHFHKHGLETHLQRFREDLVVDVERINLDAHKFTIEAHTKKLIGYMARL
jgi:hypothetical protein